MSKMACITHYLTYYAKILFFSLFEDKMHQAMLVFHQ